jgi:hypothetical protein
MIEMLVSMVLALTLSSAVLLMLLADTATSRITPEAVDLQQRARGAEEMLRRDLYQAGAGVYLGPATGALQQSLPPVLPRRAGLSGADAFSVARADAITILYVPASLTQATLLNALTPGSNLRVQPWPNCPADVVCGLSSGSSVLVFDRAEHFDAFTVTDVLSDSVRLKSWQVSHAPFSYPAGAVAAEIQWHTYYFDSQMRQLRHFDGYQTDTPVVDDVVGLNFEYVGESMPPVLPRPSAGTANCLYDASGAYRGGLVTLPGDGGSLALLPMDLFRDGPWCGDGENRFDADLLRIRKVRVTLRLQVGNDMMRGQSADFAVAGRSRSAGRNVQDYTLVFDVAPRNMGWTR